MRSLRRVKARKTPPSRPETARGAAIRILQRWLEAGEYPDRALASAGPDRAFVTEIVLGAVRRYGTLRWALDARARRAPEPEVAAAFLAAAYELLFLRDAAPHAAVFEAVETVKPRVRPQAAAFLNALLRRVAAERETLLEALARQPDPVRLSHPAFLVGRWSRAFGLTRMRRLCEWNNEGRPDLCLRPFRPRSDPSALRERLAARGIRAAPHPFAPDAFLILEPGSPPVEALPGYAEGEFTVQDPATALSVELLDPRPGERVLDACAAPGGKTAMIAERLGGRGALVAAERHEDRRGLLLDTLDRLGLRDVAAVRADAARLTFETLAALDAGAGPFDAVLVDAPCSNTGVIRRRPDARWRVDPARLRRLGAAQTALLDGAARLLKPGGRIVYSTCSLETEENEGRVGEWLARHPGFRLERARKTFPPDARCDGAYAARLVRTAGNALDTSVPGG